LVAKIQNWREQKRKHAKIVVRFFSDERFSNEMTKGEGGSNENTMMAASR